MGGEVVLKVLFGAKQNNTEFAVAVADLITSSLWGLGMIFFHPIWFVCAWCDHHYEVRVILK